MPRMSHRAGTGTMIRSQSIQLLYITTAPKHNGIVKEELIHFTEDKKHDQDAVVQFMEKTLEHLQQKGVVINKIIELTDQAASQYKSKETFYTLSQAKIPVTRHFYAVKHGEKTLLTELEVTSRVLLGIL